MISMDLARGKVRIIEIRGGRGFVRRLIDMGLAPGQVVEVISNGPPVVVKVRDSEIAIGKGVAKKVFVEEVNV